ncbi:MAG: nitroreductase family protein [Candidatus Helarchaeota archaeon]
MKILGVDQTKCIKCKECIRECPSKLFCEKISIINGEEITKIVFEDDCHACILCGHCISICPTNAVEAEGLEELGGIFEFEEARDPSKILEFERLIKLLRARRSIRRFQNKEIPRDQIEMVLDAIKYAPSASNAQSWHFTIITNPEKIEFFSKEVMKLFFLIKKALKIKPLLKLFAKPYQKELLSDPKTEYSINNIIQDFNNGEDPIFYKAPCVIVLTAPKYGEFGGCDAGIAFTYGMLAAQSLGLGSCWIGFAQEAIKRNKKLRKWLKIPKNRGCYGVVIFGYQAVKFQRVPPRNQLKLQWID